RGDRCGAARRTRPPGRRPVWTRRVSGPRTRSPAWPRAPRGATLSPSAPSRAGAPRTGRRRAPAARCAIDVTSSLNMEPRRALGAASFAVADDDLESVFARGPVGDGDAVGLHGLRVLDDDGLSHRMLFTALREQETISHLEAGPGAGRSLRVDLPER